jgi:small subunit ribosomal protein S8
MYTDTIADLLTRIRNAGQARKDIVLAPYSKTKEAILEVLKRKHFISNFNIEGAIPKKNLVIELNPEKSDLTLKRISKPGQRIYLKKSEIKKSYGGLGTLILSTPKGIITDEEAIKQNLGGELICEVF